MAKPLQNTATYCTLYIVRHGETEWNRLKIIQGQAESQLTGLGTAQARELAEALKDTPIAAVFASDLIRAKQTAEIIALQKQLEVKTSHLLRERKWGKFEGRKKAEYQRDMKDLLKKFDTLSDSEKWQFKPAEDMESDEELATRFITFIREIAIAYKGQTVLVVTHGGCIRTFLTRIGWVKYGELSGASLKNGGFIKLISDGIDFFVKEQTLY